MHPTLQNVEYGKKTGRSRHLKQHPVPHKLNMRRISRR